MEQKESCLPTMSRTRDLLITIDITVRRSKPTELRGEYFKAKSCLLDGKFFKIYIYNYISFLHSTTSGCGTLYCKSGVEAVGVPNSPIADLGTQNEEHRTNRSGDT